MSRSYEEEQSRLRQQVEGGESARDIKIPPPKEPEVNPEIYHDVEQLLFRGFLTHPLEINGVSFIFKSINHHEFDMLRWCSGIHEDGLIKDQYYSKFLAYGVFMVDGQNILPERERWLPEIVEIFSELPPPARKKLIWVLSEINRKANSAITLTEAYSFERYSRFRWAQLCRLDLMATTVTGIRGTDTLGLNYGQLVWRALNHYEDLREVTEREWEHAKFVGSCMVGKGLSSVYNQDRDRRRKELEERISRKDILLRQVLLGQDPEEAKLKGGQRMIVANTVEELTTQLERDLRGEKDWHDEVVAKEEDRVRRAVQTHREELDLLAQQRDKEFEGKMLRGQVDMTGLTYAEVQERIQRDRQVRAQKMASRVIRPNLDDPRMGQFLDKWGVYQEDEVRTTISSTDKDTVEAIPVTVPQPRAKPFRR